MKNPGRNSSLALNTFLCFCPRMFTVAPCGPRAMYSHLRAALSVCGNLTNPMGTGSAVSHLQLQGVVGNIQQPFLKCFHFPPFPFPILTQKSCFSTSLPKLYSSVLPPLLPSALSCPLPLAFIFSVTKLPPNLVVQTGPSLEFGRWEK